jgi:hypothetical protein
MRKQVIALKYHADLLAHIAPSDPASSNHLSVQKNLSGLDGFEAVQAAQQCAFAAAGRSDDDHDLPFVNV